MVWLSLFFCYLGACLFQSGKDESGSHKPSKKRKLEFLESKYQSDSDDSEASEESDSESEDPISIDYKTLEAFLLKQLYTPESLNLTSSSSSSQDKKDFPPPNKS